MPQAGDSTVRLLSHIGSPSAEKLDAHRLSGGLKDLELTLENGPDWIIEHVEASNLVGRGGASFPTGRKSRALCQAVGSKYLVFEESTDE